MLCLCTSVVLFGPETSETDVQAVLIDCSRVIFVDVAGARLFTQVGLLDEDAALLSIRSCFNAASWFVWLCSLFHRCAPSARKLEFMFICPTATVETQQKFSIPAIYLRHSSVHLHQRWSAISFTFNLPRECPEDPHIKRFNELHESSTHFCHCSRRRDVYSAAEGKKNPTWAGAASEHTNVFFFPLIYASDVPQEKPPENTTTVWVWVMLSSSSSACAGDRNARGGTILSKFDCGGYVPLKCMSAGSVELYGIFNDAVVCCSTELKTELQYYSICPVLAI